MLVRSSQSHGRFPFSTPPPPGEIFVLYEKELHVTEAWLLILANPLHSYALQVFCDSQYHKILSSLVGIIIVDWPEGVPRHESRNVQPQV